jgi:Na+-transporting NADH:ubiquinone oxidoreductase subunit NqrF
MKVFTIQECKSILKINDNTHRELTLEERRRLLHQYHWSNIIYRSGVGLESECDFYKIPKNI